MVIPVGEIFSQELLLVRKLDGKVNQSRVNYCRFVPLTGKYGWDTWNGSPN